MEGTRSDAKEYKNIVTLTRDSDKQTTGMFL